MVTQITTLIENHPGTDSALRHEHGISFLIQREDTTILFDTGQSNQFLINAHRLEVDLEAIDHVVLSHGHYDHTDGFPFFSDAVRGEFVLHVHRDFFHPKYAVEDRYHRYNGASWDSEWARKQRFDVDLVTGNGGEIVPGVHIITSFDHPHPLEERNPRFVVHRPGTVGMEIDDFRDEVSVIVETDQGLIVLVGCSHPGIMNMLDTVRARFPAPIYAVLGGTHLIEAQGKRLEEAISYLTGGGTQKLGLSHCTGHDAMEALERSSPVFYRNVTGSVLSVE